MKWAVTDLLICLINLCFCLLNLLKIKPYLCLDFSSINDWQRLSWKLTQFLTYLLHRYDSYGENRKIQWKGHMCLFPLRQQIKYNTKYKSNTGSVKMKWIYWFSMQLILFFQKKKIHFKNAFKELKALFIGYSAAFYF